MFLSRALLTYHARQLRQSPATAIFLTGGWVAAVLLTFIPGQFIAAGRAELAALFAYLPWVMAVLIPAIAMPVASEYRRGVTERLLTLPHTPVQRLFSRFAVTYALLGLWLMGFWPLVATLYYLGRPDPGPILTGLLGSWLLAGPLLAASLTICLRARSGVGGLLASLAACFLLLLVGTPTVTAWFAGVPGFGWLPATSHLTPLGAWQPFTGGLINLSSMLLLIGLTLAILGASLASRSKPRRASLPIVIGAAVSLVALLPGLTWMQLDTTTGGLHTPSRATIETLRNLPSSVTFTLHVSQNNPDVPPSIHTYTHSLTNLLLRLRAEAPRNVTVRISNADSSTAAAIGALQAGAAEQSLPAGTTYFAALAARVSGTTAVIPAFNPARQPVQEYDVMSLLSQAQSTGKPAIAILSGQAGLQENPPAWQKPLEESFTFTAIPAATGVTEIPSATSVLVLPDDAPLPPQTQEAIRTYLNRGGNVLLMADSFSRTPRTHAFGQTLGALLPEWGLQLVSQSVVADPTQATLAVQPKAGATSYPYWLQLTRDNLDAELPFTTGISKLYVPESGSFKLTSSPTALTVTPFLFSSPYARTVPLEAFESTPPELANTNLPAANGPHILAAMVSGAFSTEAVRSANLVAFADSDWLTAESLARAPDNMALLTGILHYLSGQPGLTALRAKGTEPRTFTRIESMAGRLAQAATATEQQIAARLYEVTQALASNPPASPDAFAAAQEEEFTLRQQLRDIRAQTRHRLQTLENALLLINLALMPTLTGIFFFLQRRRQRLKATSTL